MASPWFPGWSKRVTLTVDHTQVGSGGVTSSPILGIGALVPAGFWSAVAADGSDIRFVADDNATVFPHELVTLDVGTQTLEAWVEVAVLSDSVDTVFYCYYDNPSADAPTPYTWDGYAGVWHMKSVGSSIADSAAAANSAVTSATSAEGKSGSAQSVSGKSSGINWLAAPVDITPVSFASWVDTDVSASVGATATGVIIRFANASTAPKNAAYRKNGSTDVIIDTIRESVDGNSYQMMAGVGVASGVLELYIEDANVSVELVAWVGSSGVFYTNSVDVTPAPSAWTDVDVGEPLATLGFFESIAGVANTVGVRANGSTDELQVSGGYHLGIVAPLVAGVAEVYDGAWYRTVYLTGYLTSGVTVHPNAVNRSLATTNAYIDIPLESGANGVIIEVAGHPAYADFFALRANGAVTDDYYELWAHSWFALKATDGVIEGKISSTRNKFWELAHTIAPKVTIADDAALDVTTQISILAWVNLDAETLETERYIVYKNGSYRLLIDDAGAVVGSIWDATGKVDTQSTDGTVASGGWHHVALVYDKTWSPAKIKLYVDGVEVSYVSQDTGSGNLVATTTDMLLGSGASATNYLDGLVDDIWLSATALSAAEVATAYASQLAPASFMGANVEEEPPAGCIFPMGMESAEAFGTPNLPPLLEISAQGIGSRGGFFPPTFSNSTQNISPSGIATAEAVGTPTLVRPGDLFPTGIASPLTMYWATITNETSGSTAYLERGDSPMTIHAAPGDTITLICPVIDQNTPTNNPILTQSPTVAIRRTSDDKWWDFVASAWDVVANYAALGAEHKKALTDKGDGSYEYDWNQATADASATRTYLMAYEVPSGTYQGFDYELWMFDALTAAANATGLLAATVDMPGLTDKTVSQVLQAVWADTAGKWTLVGTTLTLYAPDGTTAVATFTVDSATDPTSRTPA